MATSKKEGGGKEGRWAEGAVGENGEEGLIPEAEGRVGPRRSGGPRQLREGEGMRAREGKGRAPLWDTRGGPK